MSNKRNPQADHEVDARSHPSQLMIYQIRLQGHLGHQWTEWFDGLTITLTESGDTLLTGPVIDQPALYGLLRKVCDLGLALVSVMRVEPSQTDEADVKE